MSTGNRYEDASDQARQLLADFDEIDLAEALASQTVVIAAVRALHHPTVNMAGTRCDGCTYSDPFEAPEPRNCPTLAIVDKPLHDAVRRLENLARRWRNGFAIEHPYGRTLSVVMNHRRIPTAEGVLAVAAAIAVRWENGLLPDLVYAQAIRHALDPQTAPAPGRQEASADEQLRAASAEAGTALERTP